MISPYAFMYSGVIGKKFGEKKFFGLARGFRSDGYHTLDWTLDAP